MNYIRSRWVITMYDVPLPAIVTLQHEPEAQLEAVVKQARRIALFHFSAHPSDAIGVIPDRRVIGPQLALFERNRSIDMEGAL